MSDNFNINTTQDQANEAEGLERDNPSMTYVDFANQMVKNQQSQAQQAALIQTAQELAKQQKLSTRQKTEADSMGVNPEMKDFFTVPEAVAYLKGAGVDDDQIQSFVSALGGKQVVSRAAVDTIIRKKEAGVKAGQPFIASSEDARNPSLVTKEGDNLVDGQSYYDTGEKDEDGNAIYGHGGKEPVDPTVKANQKQQQTDEHNLAELGKELSKVTNPSRGNFISQNIGRAFRALNEIHEHPDLPRQTLSYIQEEIGGIFMGGVPPESALQAADVTNLKQQINGTINKYTGVVQYFKKEDATNQSTYLTSLLTGLFQSTVDMAKSMMEAKVRAYPGLVDRIPDQVKELLASHEDILDKGLTEGAKKDMKKVQDDSKAKEDAKKGGGDLEAKKAALKEKLNAMLKQGK